MAITNNINKLTEVNLIFFLPANCQRRVAAARCFTDQSDVAEAQSFL